MESTLDARDVPAVLASPAEVVSGSDLAGIWITEDGDDLCSSSRDTSERFPPALGCGRKWPSRRYCHTHRFAVASPMAKRRASRTFPPSPRS